MTTLCTLELDDAASALSPRVIQMICQAECMQSVGNDTQYVTDDGLLDMHRIKMLLPDGTDSFEYFLQCVTGLAPVFQQVESAWRCDQGPPALRLETGYLGWLSSPQLLQTAYDVMRDDLSTGPLLSLLMSTAQLERSLGDLYLLRGQHCPSMLKDLLVTAELLELLGPTMIKLLRVVMGPPISLNLRNVVWHGFPSPGEIKPWFGYLILCIMATIGSSLLRDGVSARSITHRTYVDFPQLTRVRSSFPELTAKHVPNLEELFRSTTFIAKSMKTVWLLALAKYKEQSYGESVCLLLPQLEHGMRRVFAAINNCPERTLTAENTVLFTTFNEILSKWLPDSSENKLKSDFGDTYMSLLLDMLCYPKGPRLRDRLSHGEVDLASLSADVATYVLCTCAALCLVFLAPDHELWQVNVFKALHYSAQNYESAFHPVSILKNHMKELGDNLVEWVHIARPPAYEVETTVPWSQQCNDVNTVCKSKAYQTACHLVDRYDVRHILPGDLRSNCCLIHPFGTELTGCVTTILSSVQIITLYRYNTQDTGAADLSPAGQEEELVGLMNRVLAIARLVSAQVLSGCQTRYAQWTAKQLRSRQRTTYRRMLDSVPRLSQGLRLVLLTMLCCYSTLESFNAKPVAAQVAAIKFLKYMLRYCENLHTCTGPDINKWDEVLRLTEDMLSRMSRL